MTKKIILSLIGCVVLAAIGGGLYFLANRSAGTAGSYSATKTPYSVLMQTNSAFVQAQAAVNAGNYEQAKVLYTQALAQASDSIQRGQIEFKLAVVEQLQGNWIQAIDMYKAVVANSDYANYTIVKAYAVQNMVEIHYRNGDPALTAEIFKDAPYSQMAVSGNTGLSYRHLNEYAVSFYPLALPELRIADWYASYADATSTPDGSATSTYPTIIQNSIKSANADINRIKDDTNASGLIPDILSRKASLYLTMYLHHLASAQDAEQVCRDALNMFASIGLSYKDGFARYYYAVLLSKLGPSRASDLRMVLAPFYTTSSYKNGLTFSFFAGEKANYLGQKMRLATLAKEDSQFKNLLISLGWRTSDF